MKDTNDDASVLLNRRSADKVKRDINFDLVIFRGDVEINVDRVSENRIKRDIITSANSRGAAIILSMRNIITAS